MSDSVGVPPTWTLLLDLYPVFLSPGTLTDPANRDLSAGYGVETHVACLQNTLKVARKKQQSFPLSKWMDGLPSMQRLVSRLEHLASRFEAHIDRQIENYSDSIPPPSPYPRLNLLREVLLDTTPPGNATSDRFQHTDGQHNHDAASMSTSSSSTTSISDTEAHIEDVARFIQFPRDICGIQSLRGAIDTFADCLDNELFTWGDQSTISTELDFERIQRAYQCSSLSTSLFFHLAVNGTCNAQHQAKLDLSSVRKGKMKSILRKCQDTTIERWLPAVFTHSLEEPTSGISAFNSICSSTENAEYLRLFFNSDTMWSLNEDNTSNPLTIIPRADKLLEDFLGKRTFEETLPPKRRSLAGIFLAATFFQLIGSPWLKEPFEAHDISVDVPHTQPLHRWRVHASRSLVRDAGIGDLAESVAALGVLFLELETGFEASWAEKDEISGTGKRSHRKRLRRLASEWNEGIPDDIQKIARSCLDFKRLVNRLPVGDMTEDMRNLAITYQHILMPIFRRNGQLLKELEELSPASFAPPGTLPRFRSTVVPVDPIIPWKLFDTQDLSPSLFQDKLTNCKRFFRDAEDFFQCIEAIRSNPNLPTTRKKIKIVLLDSGLDTEETIIAEAIDEERINVAECKSFVNSAWHQADDMHGTNVAELLIRAAPTAEIVIGKVCEHRDSTDDLLPSLAKAIKWAAKEQEADILCLALGYRIPDEAVETALDYAIRKKVLVVAAASNDGGLDGRARPACLEGIICMHASDGMGIRGGMNPTRVENVNNFLTLGDGVDVLWKGENLLKAGTSFAVPIAAGLIACMLEFIADKMPDLSQLQVTRLKKKEVMEAILVKMSRVVLVGGQHFFIHPINMCNWRRDDAVQRAVERVQEALQGV